MDNQNKQPNTDSTLPTANQPVEQRTEDIIDAPVDQPGTQEADPKKKKEKKSFTKSLFPFLKPKDGKKKKKGNKNKNYKEVDPNEIKTEDTVKQFNQGLIDVKDLIAPAAIEVDFNELAMGNKFFRTFFALGYPRYVGPNWLEPLINFEYALDISTFYYPVDSKEVLNKLRRKIAEMEATVNADLEAGKIVDPKIKVALADARDLQEQLAKGTEKFFHFALYVTIHADSLKELEKISKSVESTLGAIGVIIKPATLQQDSAFESTIPTCTDKLYVTRNMDTTSLATTFPFVTSELTMDEGVMYGINKYNKSLVVFDRFQLENANATVFATSGAGKSYLIKIELLRSLMFGVEAIIIDPEREYAKLCETIGGAYISFSQDGENKLNPFELTGLFDSEEDELRSKILSLHGLIKVMIGGQISSEEDAIIDRALILTYKEKGITPEPATHVNEPPLLEDLYKVLKGMAEPEAHSLASRLEKYIRGSAAGIFDKKSNIDINNTFTVFSIRDLSDELRPVAMYMMLEFIWTKIRKDRKKRILVVDEAWWMMQYPDAARFLFSIAKRARKYYLGLTTITQDVEDFLATDYGKAIVTNSSIQILMKQSPAAVDRLQKVFYLSEGEKTFLLSCGVGEGLFFAGPNHVAIEVISSKNEHRIITSDPKDLERYEQEKVEQAMINDMQKDVLDEAVVLNTDSSKRELEKVDPMDPRIASDEQPKIEDGNLVGRSSFLNSDSNSEERDVQTSDVSELVDMPVSNLSEAQLGEQLATNTVIPSNPNVGNKMGDSMQVPPLNNNLDQQASPVENSNENVSDQTNDQILQTPNLNTDQASDDSNSNSVIDNQASDADNKPDQNLEPDLQFDDSSNTSDQVQPQIDMNQSPGSVHQEEVLPDAPDVNQNLVQMDTQTESENNTTSKDDILQNITNQVQEINAVSDNTVTPQAQEKPFENKELVKALVDVADDVKEEQGADLQSNSEARSDSINPDLAAQLNTILDEHEAENIEATGANKDATDGNLEVEEIQQGEELEKETEISADTSNLPEDQEQKEGNKQKNDMKDSNKASGSIDLNQSEGNLGLNTSEEMEGEGDGKQVGADESADLEKLLKAEKKMEKEADEGDSAIPIDSNQIRDPKIPNSDDPDVLPNPPQGSPFK